METQQATPKNSIIVGGNGKVIKVEEWINWNGEPYAAVVIEELLQPPRQGEYMMNIGNPDGGAQAIGALEVALEPLHQDFRPKYMELFRLSNPSEEDLLRLGFNNYKIVRH